MADHDHRWRYMNEDDNYIYFRCTFRGCHLIKKIRKDNGEEEYD